VSSEILSHSFLGNPAHTCCKASECSGVGENFHELVDVITEEHGINVESEAALQRLKQLKENLRGDLENPKPSYMTFKKFLNRKIKEKQQK